MRKVAVGPQNRAHAKHNNKPLKREHNRGLIVLQETATPSLNRD
jgi:hypothetical protein